MTTNKQMEEELEIVISLRNVTVLREFNRRFKGSVLHECCVTEVLTGIGLNAVKRCLGELGYRVVKKPSNQANRREGGRDEKLF